MNRSKKQNYSIIQRGIAYLIALAMIFSISLPAMAASRDVPATVEGEFTIVDGVITDYSGLETDLVIPDVIDGQTVTGIGTGAFRSKGLTSVALPDTVTEVMASAFRDNALVSVEFSEGLEKIGSYAFRGNALVSVEFNEALETIDSHAFRDNALESVDLPGALTALGQQSFATNSLTAVSFPASLLTIGPGAFLQNSITSIELNDGLVTIGANAFANQPIVSLVIPDSVQSIGSRAFSSTGITEGGVLQSVDLGQGVQTIDKYAFEKNQLTSIVIPDSVIHIDDAAFWKNNITEVDLGKGVERIGFQAFTENFLETVIIPSGVTEIAFNAFTVNPAIDLVFESMLEILEEAAAIDSSLYTEESVQVLTAAVSAAKAVHDVQVPSLTDINAAIKVIQEALETLVSVPLDGPWGTEHFIYEGTALVGFSALGELKFNEDKELVIPEKTPDGLNLLSIGDRAFNQDTYGTGGIQTLVLPETLESIGLMAFRNNNIIKVDLPDSLTTLGNGAFAANHDLAVLTLSNSLTSIPQGAFSFNKITELVIPEGVTSIGGSAFSDNKQLVDLSLPDTLVEIGSRAFWGSAVKELTIPGSVQFIRSDAFINGTIHTLILEEGVANIAARAFKNNDLGRVIIPRSVVSLHATTFDGNVNIDVRYAALSEILEEAAVIDRTLYTEDSIQALEDAVTAAEVLHEKAFPLLAEISSAVDAIEEAISNLVFVSLDGEWGTEHFIYDGTALIGFSALGELKFTEDKDLVIPQKTPDGLNLLSIGDSAFNRDAYGTEGIQTLVLPETLENIGLMAFRNNNIIKVDLPDSLTTLGNAAFTANHDLAALTLSNSLTSIPQAAFSFNRITELMIPEGVTSIGPSAFSDNTSLTSLTLPSSLTEIGSRAFWGSALTELTIPGNETSIGSYAFNRGSLERLTLEEGIVSIANQAFANNVLNEVTIPESVTTLHKAAFNGNTDIDLSFALMVRLLSEAGAIETWRYTPETVLILEEAVEAGQAIHTQKVPLLTAINEGAEAIQTALESLIERSLEGSWTTEHFTYDGTTLTGFSDFGELKFTEDKELVIPEKTPDGLNLLSIGDRAFNRDAYGTEGIQTLVLPETLESIGLMAFRNNNIIEVDLPDSLTTLGNAAFTANQDLAVLTLSNSLTSIPQAAFSFNKITELVIPEGVTSIGGSAFSDNKQLVDLTLPDTLVEIGSRAFWGSALTELTIPGSVQSIGSDAFINGTIHTLILEEGVANIAARAFKNNDLGRVIIPRSVVSLHATTFDDNVNIDVRYAALSEILEEAMAIDGKLYTEDSFQALEDAVTAAEVLHEKAFPLLAEISSAVAAIEEAIEGLEDKPLAITEMEPSEDVKFRAGDQVTLSFRSLSGAEAWYSIALPLDTAALESVSRRPMIETEPGLYEASWTVPEDLVIHGALVLFGVTKDGVTVEDAAPGTITVEAISTPDPQPEVTRIAGSNRIRTAIEASRRAYDQADTVILASGYDFPDALAGAPLAEALGAPILLTQRTEISLAVMEEIQRLGAQQVILLGGDLALSGELEAQLDGFSVRRLAGSNRFHTAALIAEEVLETSGSRRAFLTNGLDFPDALSVGPAAARDGSPVFFTRQDRLSVTTLEALEELGIETVTIIGGELAVGDNVAKALEAAGFRVDRIDGRNRYATAVEVARASFADPEYAVIASGQDFPDALAAGPLAAGLDAPLLLVHKDRVIQDVLDYLQEKNIRKVLILGGPVVIDDSVLEIIEKAITPSEETVAMYRAVLKAA